MRVLRVDDVSPGTPVPSGDGGDYRDGGGRPYRDDVRPIEIAQPQGPSFTLDGRHLAWQRWDMRVGFHPREGLVLHDIGYTDGGERRSICHRASIAELVIPYGDPGPTDALQERVRHRRVRPRPAHELARARLRLPGRDRLPGRRRRTAGTASRTRSATPSASTRRTTNLLWKHTDDHSGRVDRARSRRLVISSIVTVGNYEYGFFWYLHQDASIEFEGKLTGILHTAGSVSAERSPHSLPLGDGIVTSHHQHFFCARLDLDIDGTANVAVRRRGGRPTHGAPANPDGSAFRPRAADATSASRRRGGWSRRTRPAASASRTAPAATASAIPSPTSSCPGDNVRPMQQPDSQVRERARFIDHHVWVTPYRRDERYPAGEYPNQDAGRRRAAALDGRRPQPRRRGRRALVRVRRPPLPPARGLAGDAGRSGAASSCGRSASSTATRPWTCRRRPGTPATRLNKRGQTPFIHGTRASRARGEPAARR